MTSTEPLTRSRQAEDGVGDLSMHASFAGLLCVFVTAVWALTGRGYFWPMWVWFALAVTFAVHFSGRWVFARRGWRSRLTAAAQAFIVLAAAINVAVWALAGGGYFWPAWPLFGLATTTGLVMVVVHRDKLPGRARERALVRRVDDLTRTRRGALDVQAAELRRIERDLHDGAQARLVALSLQLGRAEERLSDRPDEAALVRAARLEASNAIKELRDLARGIAPPVLADRGLTAAVESLGERSASDVQVESRLGQTRPLPVVETAAYFVVAESLTNVAKHARGAKATVLLEETVDRLVVTIDDNGPGGADPAGSGLTGLRARVEALDGILAVASPVGGGTTILAELPTGL